jgi:hypothetical protein
LSPGGGAGPWAVTFTGLHQLETWAQPTCEACCEKVVTEDWAPQGSKYGIRVYIYCIYNI